MGAIGRASLGLMAAPMAGCRVVVPSLGVVQWAASASTGGTLQWGMAGLCYLWVRLWLHVLHWNHRSGGNSCGDLLHGHSKLSQELQELLTANSMAVAVNSCIGHVRGFGVPFLARHGGFAGEHFLLPQSQVSQWPLRRQNPSALGKSFHEVCVLCHGRR